MRRLFIIIITAVSIVPLVFAQRHSRREANKVVQLSPPQLSSEMSLEEVLAKRRSIRNFKQQALNYKQLGQLLWAGQGITNEQMGFRTAPSAGAIYPITLYVATEEGLFVYEPVENMLVQTIANDIRRELSSAALGQIAVAEAGCDIIITGSIKKVAAKYRSKARTFTLLEAGHVAQNILLQAVAMDLGAVPVGAFDTSRVGKLCRLSSELEPFYIIPVGYPAVDKSESQAKKVKPASDSKQLKAVLIAARSDFRDEELFETQKVLEDAGIQTTVASSRTGTIRGMLGGKAQAELSIGQIKVDDYDAVIFIGGRGTREYFDNPVAHTIARQAKAKNKILAAVCIAPTILANAGVLEGVKVTSYSSQKIQLERAGATFVDDDVWRDGLIITASGPDAAEEFGRTIVEALKNK